MNLKIENIADALNLNGEVWISNKAFESDVQSMMDYYVRTKDSDNPSLLKKALDGDFLEFGAEFLTSLIYQNDQTHMVLIGEVTGDKVRLIRYDVS